jgi:hypothetical protein
MKTALNLLSCQSEEDRMKSPHGNHLKDLPFAALAAKMASESSWEAGGDFVGNGKKVRNFGASRGFHYV